MFFVGLSHMSHMHVSHLPPHPLPPPLPSPPLHRARQAKFLRKKWAASSGTNCLGRLIFLGTPFYSKYWDRYAFLAMAANIVLLSCLVFAVIVGAVVCAKLVTTQSMAAVRARLSGSEVS